MMKNLIRLAIVFLFFSCQEEVLLPLGEKEGPLPVIEAYWTDQPAYNEVKISLTKNYYDTTEYQPVSDAIVSITSEDTGEVIPFVFLSGSQTYRPANPQRRGVPGHRYSLRVQWKDYEFESLGLLLEPPRVDSVTWKFEEKRVFRDAGYYIKVFGQIPFERDNNYRIRVIENDTLKNQREDYLLFDDTFGLKFFETGLELDYTFQENDQVRLELFRLNKDVFEYLNQLVNLLFNDGGLFSPPPQNPQSNIEVRKGEIKVLGYFVVAPVLTRTLVIQSKYD